MKIAGVSVNFRDVNGWTALHWAAYCGRDRIVGLLISLGGAPGPLTDPSTKNPTGKTPADLDSEKGYKGVAGYLAESSLSAHLSSLKLYIKEANLVESSGEKSAQPVPGQISASSSNGDFTDDLSMTACLAAVRNATQAAARIHQMFSVQSFPRLQFKEYGDEIKNSQGALSFIALGSHKKCNDHENSAAIQIQNAFRSWKRTKNYAIIRKRILKIQAHKRGHQVRKNFRKIIWVVGILEKVILRWRRKGRGLRGFRRKVLDEVPSMEVSSSKEHDYDFLKDRRKQTEERLHMALARVESMVQCPEARDQYHQLLNTFTEIQVNSSEGTFDDMDPDNNLIDTDALLFDDNLIYINLLMEDDICMDDLLGDQPLCDS